MSFYTDLQADAAGLLAEFGQQVMLRRQHAGSYDPATGTASTTTADYFGSAVLLDYSGYELTNNASIQTGDKRVLLSAVDVPQPMPCDLIYIDSVQWSVKASTSVAPAGTAVLYDVHVRQ